MNPEEEKRLQSLFIEQYKAWRQSQESQTDAIAYERSFREMMHSLGQGLLANETDTGSKKKSKDQLWHYRDER